MTKPSTAKLKKEEGKYQLYVNGEPFYIKGAGLEFGNIEALARHGGNSFRTWRTDNGKQTGKEVLDEAQKHGLYVTMGLDLGKERHGFDYSNEEQVAKQFKRIKKEVLEYKDHPALIIWAIGNELNLHAENQDVWHAVNDISKFIHKVDTNHLTTTTLAGINRELVDNIKEKAPDLDLLSIQMYADIYNLPQYIEETGWDGPYMVTEWGATGHWEVERTAWDAPIENNSSAKADYYLERYKEAIAPQKAQCIGSYVFLWGQKQERTPTWYGIFMESGNETEAVDVMHYLWNDEWPDNRSPRLKSFTLNDKTAYEDVYLNKGEKYKSIVEVFDHDQDSLTYRWEVLPEATELGDGGDFEPRPKAIEDVIEGSDNVVNLIAPDKEGAYRLFVYAMDGNNHSAHANIPFYVK